MPPDGAAPTCTDWPLAHWAEARLAHIARTLDAPALTGLGGDALLRMRARFNRFRVAGQVSAGGGCRFHRARDGWIALNLSRPDDHALLPALLGTADYDPADPEALPGHLALASAEAVVAQGRMLGMAIARLGERPLSPSITTTAPGQRRSRSRTGPPLVVDLAALWAGPLAARLLGLAGARVVKVESATRPDTMRTGDPALFDWLNRDKEHRAVDFRDARQRADLLELLRAADVVIEAARPRALLQLGIDAEALVREVPGLAWITITGHGVSGDGASWIGFGDDTAVAGGLSTALIEATGKVGFVGDAIADPLSGLMAAGEAASRLVSGRGGRSIVAMSGTAAAALDEARRDDPRRLAAQLQAWAAAEGQPCAEA